MLLIALALGLVTAMANLLGSYLAVVVRRPSQATIANAVAFGGGFLLAAALLEMVPKSLERGPWMPGFVALGYLLIYLAEHLLNVHLHRIPDNVGDHQHGGADPTPTEAVLRPQETRVALLGPAAGLAALVGFNIHDFIDGLAIGSALLASQALGTLVFLAVLFHEVPAGFVIAAVVRSTGRSRRDAVLAGASIGLVTLVGIVVPFLTGTPSSFTTGVFLAIAAGSFIYLGASILIPMLETARSRAPILFVLLGFALFFASSQLVGLFLTE